MIKEKLFERHYDPKNTTISRRNQTKRFTSLKQWRVQAREAMQRPLPPPPQQQQQRTLPAYDPYALPPPPPPTSSIDSYQYY